MKRSVEPEEQFVCPFCGNENPVAYGNVVLCHYCKDRYLITEEKKDA